MSKAFKSRSPKILWRQIGEEPETCTWTEKDDWMAKLMERELKDYRRPGAPAFFEATLQNFGRNLVFRGEFRIDLKPQCHRCGKEFALPLHEKFRLILFPFTGQDLTEREDDFEDVDSSVITGEELDLTRYFLEQVFLAMPMTLLCKPNCRGRCLTCGADLSVAPCGCQEQKKKVAEESRQQERQEVWGKLKDFKV